MRPEMVASGTGQLLETSSATPGTIESMGSSLTKFGFMGLEFRI